MSAARNTLKYSCAKGPGEEAQEEVARMEAWCYYM